MPGTAETPASVGPQFHLGSVGTVLVPHVGKRDQRTDPIAIRVLATTLHVENRAPDRRQPTHGVDRDPSARLTTVTAVVALLPSERWADPAGRLRNSNGNV